MRCKKNNAVFDIQIVKLPNYDNLFYIKFKKKEGSLIVFNEICTKILTQLIL